jgi:hypothetical protein
MDEFKKKFTLLFSLLDDVLTEDEILEKHRSLFYYYPDPVYEMETSSSASPSASDEVIVMEPPPSVVSSPPVTVAVSSVTTPVTPTISSVETPVLKSILKEEEVKEKEKEIQKNDKAEEELIKQLMAETMQNNSFDLKTFDTTPSPSSSSSSPSSDGEKVKNTIQNKACFNCDLESDYLTTKTFQHSRSNSKDFKYISACFDCLEKKTINDY